MLFNSFEFIIFLFVVLVVYWSLPRRGRLLALLVAGYVFYGSWDYRFLALLAATTVVDFWAALAIHATADPGRRKLFLCVDTAGVTVHLPTLHIILPVGISPLPLRVAAYTGMLLCLILLSGDYAQPFIYFAF